MAEILLAEDEKNVREGIALELESDGHVVRQAANGEKALREYALKKPDLILLDVMMPKVGGYAVCAEIRRADPVTPIIFLTAKDAEIDRVRGLDLGADDYIGKTAGPHEILARVRAALRRSGLSSPAASGEGNAVFRIGAMEVDGIRLKVTLPDGTCNPLYPREVSLLRLLAARIGQAVDRAEMLKEISGERYFPESHALDQLVFNVRLRLGRWGNGIETVRGVGYRLCTDAGVDRSV